MVMLGTGDSDPALETERALGKEPRWVREPGGSGVGQAPRGQAAVHPRGLDGKVPPPGPRSHHAPS